MNSTRMCHVLSLALILAAIVLLPVGQRVANASSIYDAAINAQNPVAYWTLNDSSKSNGSTAVDNVGGHSGTYENGVANVTPAPANIGGSAAGFSGGTTPSAPEVTFSDSTGSPALPSGGADRTLILWLNTSVANDPSNLNNYMAFNYGSQGNGNLFALYVNSQNGIATATDYGANAYNTVPVNDGQWHMIAVTVSSSTWTVYSDISGTMTGGSPSTIATNTVTGGNQPAIGGTFTFGGNHVDAFGGSISSVALFNTVLTQPQLQAIYAAAYAVPEPSSVALLAIGSIGLFAFYRRQQKPASA